jgi:hypothetical protein
MKSEFSVILLLLQKWGFQGVGERKMVNRKELQGICHHSSLIPVTPLLWL